MGGRYWRTFECEDCGVPVTRRWQTGRAKVCGQCGGTRTRVAVEAAHLAVEAHKRACRLELQVRRALEAAGRPASAVWPPALTGGGGAAAPPPAG